MQNVGDVRHWRHGGEHGRQDTVVEEGDEGVDGEEEEEEEEEVEDC